MSSLRNRIRAALDSKLLIVGQHFEIKCTKENELGSGGFGFVWSAIDKRDNKPVAVKQVKRNQQSEKFCDRELKFLHECKHRNIVQLLEFIVDDSSFYFVLELCVGNLDDFVKDKHVDFLTCLGYMSHICAGLKCLHDKRIAHRDLKPTNILVKDNIIKVADLGLAKEFTASCSGQSATGGVGTTGWMAPELCVDASRVRYDESVDIYGLALLFLSLWTHLPGEHLTAHTGTRFVYHNIYRNILSNIVRTNIVGYFVCFPSEGRLTLGQWRNAHKDTQQPNIMSDADDVLLRLLKDFILKMTSYFPNSRPKIKAVYELFQRISKGSGKSIASTCHTSLIC